MVNDTLIKGIQCRLRDALNIINNIKLSDVSSLEEMGELVEKNFSLFMINLINF
jgi:hypothetical protein